MSWITTVCITFLCLINAAHLTGQTETERKQLADALLPFPPVADYTPEIEAPDSEFSWAFGKLFLFYKRFISSQDSGACTFHPSCSVYAIRAIRKYGVITGMIRGFDRLTRCNPGAKGHYPIHPESQKLHDPLR